MHREEKEKLKKQMIAEAKELYGDVHCIKHVGSLENSFTEHKGLLLFWFNTEDNSTRTLSSRYKDPGEEGIEGTPSMRKKKNHLEVVF